MSDDEAEKNKSTIDKLTSVYFAVEESKALRKSIRESLQKGDEELKKVRNVLKGFQFAYDSDEAKLEKKQVPKITELILPKKVNPPPKLITVTEMLARKTRNGFLKSSEPSVDDVLFEKEDAKITSSRTELKKLSSAHLKRESKSSLRQSREQKTRKSK